MADDQDYINAAIAVKAGTATPNQVWLNDRMATQAGQKGGNARTAQEDAGKR